MSRIGVRPTLAATAFSGSSFEISVRAASSRTYGADFVAGRYHRDGKYVTGAGVSASIDTGLFVASLLAGEQVAKTLQLGIEYYPAPPFPEQSPEDVAPEIQERIRRFESTGGAAQMKLLPPFKEMFTTEPA